MGDLSEEETSEKSWKLGSAAALMIIVGYPGELILEADQLKTRWVYWALAMIPFIYIVYTLVWSCQRHQPGARHQYPQVYPYCSVHDCALMVHLPHCLRDSNDGSHRRQCCCRHPDGILHLRHCFEMWCRLPHLQHHQLKEQGRAKRPPPEQQHLSTRVPYRVLKRLGALVSQV